MKYLLTLLIILLPACTTLQTAPAFPEQSELLLKECPILDQVPEGTTKLSEAEKVIILNYTLYYQCRNQTKGWIDWYTKQKENK
jgi:hypothetical protein